MCKRVVFAPVKTPLFLPSTLQTLLDTEGEIVTPMFQERGGHPIVLSNAMIPHVLSWNGQDGLRGAIRSMTGQRVFVPVEDNGVVLSTHHQHEHRDLETLQAYYEQNKIEFVHPRLRLSLEREDELFNARAKLLLLLIGHIGSVSVASRMMALSPSKAWNILNKLEEVLGYSVITRHKGGALGSRSELTDEGLRLITTWQRYEEHILRTVNGDFQQFRKAVMQIKVR